MARGLPHGRTGVETVLLPDGGEAFIRANTALTTPPHVPEIRLHLASEAHDLWKKTEDELQTVGLPPPFWAFAWAGGQGLARYVLDHPESVRCKRVLDFASGSGLVAIAAATAGAGHVLASDTDPFCAAAIRLNAAENGVALESAGIDLIGSGYGWDVVLAGDVFYDRELAGRLIPWFVALRSRRAEILIGDPGRFYLPRDRLEELGIHYIPVSRALEDAEVKKTTVWRFA